jgi:hypothetical protein
MQIFLIPPTAALERDDGIILALGFFFFFFVVLGFELRTSHLLGLLYRCSTT